MKRTVLATTAAAAVLAVATMIATPSFAHGPRWGGGGYGAPCPMGGPGMGMGYGRHMGWGRGMGYGQQMGRGMGYGPQMGYGSQMGYGPWGVPMQPKELTVEDVKTFFEQRLAWRGNPNIKLGDVKEKDENTIVAEIVTQDGSLVQRVEIDRKTGRRTPAK